MAEVANVSSAAVVVGDRDLVTCKVHNTLRQAKFMSAIPVFNADREVIKFTYVCQPGCECKSRAERSGFPLMPAMMNSERNAAASVGDPWNPAGRMVSQPPPSRITAEALDLLESSGAAAAGSQSQKPNGSPPPSVAVARTGPARYYDIGAQAAPASRVGPKKVCWCCGMDDHEKYQCWNQLCKRCHGLQYDSNDLPHKCSQVPPSPFVLVAPLLDSELKYARCVACNRYGHLDCRTTSAATSSSTPASSSTATTIKSGSSLTCCYCGECGHHAFDCPQQSYPDRWVQSVERLGREMGYVAPSGPAPPQGTSHPPGTTQATASLGGGGRMSSSSAAAMTSMMGMANYPPYHGGGGGGGPPLFANTSMPSFGGNVNQRQHRPQRSSAPFGSIMVGGDAAASHHHHRHNSSGGSANRPQHFSSGDSGVGGSRSRQQQQEVLQRATSSAVDGKNPARADYYVRDRASFGQVSSAGQAPSAQPPFAPSQPVRSARQLQNHPAVGAQSGAGGGGNRWGLHGGNTTSAAASGAMRSTAQQQTPPPQPQAQQPPTSRAAPQRTSRRRRPRDDDSGSEPDFHF